MSDDSEEFGGYGPTTPFQSAVKPKQRAGGGRAGKSKQTEKVADPNPSRKAGGGKSGTSNVRDGKRRKVVNDIDVDDRGSRKDVVEIVDDAAEEDEERAVEDGLTVASSDDDGGVAEVDTKASKNKATSGGRQGTREANAPGSRKRQAKGKQQKSNKVEQSEDENDDDEVIAIEPSAATRNGRKVAQTSGQATGQKAGTTKGKSKATKDKERETIDVEEPLDGPEGVAALIDRVSKHNGNPNGGYDSPRSNNKSDTQLTRLREKVDRLEKDNDTLTRQLEEVFRVRETEAEALLRTSEQQYEAKIRALEELNQTLTLQLTKKQSLLGTGKSSILHLITREAADEERRLLDKENAKLKTALEEVKKQLLQKDKEVEELRRTEKELRVELMAEIDRANTLAKKTSRPQPTPRPGLPLTEDPKNAEAIKLYEDLTNIIVLNVKPQPGQLKEDEWIFTCCYTHTNETDTTNATISISFSLRSYDEMADGEHVRWIQYLPMQLDKESPDFVKKLGFLNAPFQFERNQLALFLRTLYTNFEEIVKGERDDDSDVEDNNAMEE